jgi:hypothetical protein
MRDHKYRDLATGSVLEWGWDKKDFRSESLRLVAERFLYSNIRGSTFALMPAWIALQATREQLWFDHATIKAGETIDPNLSNYHSAKITPEMEAEFNRLVAEYRQIDKDKARRSLHDIGITYVEGQLRWSNATAISIDALFAMIILDSWAAFECLASDLWVVTMNEENGTLATRLELSGEIGHPNKAAISDTTKYNIKTLYGSYCLESRRVSFQRLENIKRVYAATFGEHVRKLFDDVENGYIHALHAFRNAFLHRAGEADQTFIDQIQRFSEFRGISVGDKLLPDGEQVKKMRDASVELSRRLIQIADNVLTPS